MKILMFGMSSYPGGIENYIVNYFCHPSFPSENIQIDFITYEDTIAYDDKLKEKGYRIYRVPHLKRNPLGYYKAVKKVFEWNGYDAVYVNMLTAANALPVFLYDHFQIRKLILHAHASSTVSGVIRRILHKVNRRYCNSKATLRLACSEKAGKWLFEDKEFFVIPNAIDCERFKPSGKYRNTIREAYGVTENTLLLGHVGRFAEEKNHEFMIDILQKLVSDYVDAKIMFVGDGYTKSAVEQKVKEQNLQDRVIFVGTTSETEKYYPAFDVFLFPSIFEGFGMAALEAQSCGVPCICSDTLSPLLNVTRMNKNIGLEKSVTEWAKEVKDISNIQTNKMNERVRKSEFNIENQIRKLSDLLIRV